MVTEPVTIGGIAVLLISSIGGWIKVWRDTKKNNGNGVLLKEVKETVKNTDEKVDDLKVDIAVIKKEVKNQKEHCGQVTKSFEKQIENNRNKIFNLKK